MKWSSQEENFLKRFFKNTSNKRIASVLDKSESSIRNKALRMGLEKIDNNDVFCSNLGMRYNNPNKFLE